MPMKRTLVVLTVVITAVFISSACVAQYTEGFKDYKWGISFGFFRPIDENLRGGKQFSPIGADDNWVDIKLSYTVKKDEEERPVSFLALDWIAPASSFSGLRMTPVTYNVVFRPDKGKFGKMHFTAGAGIFPIKIKTYDLNQWKKFDTTKLGIMLGGGVDFSKNSRISLNYLWVPDVDAGRYYGSGGSIFRAGYDFSGATLVYTIDVF